MASGYCPNLNLNILKLKTKVTELDYSHENI